MKRLCLILLSCLLLSCEEEIQTYNDLSPAERAEIERRSSEQCFADTQLEFTRFANETNSQLSSYVAGQYWAVKQTGSATSTDYIYVWKRTGDAVYFIYKVGTGLNSTSTFVKMTPAFNNAMVIDLQDKRCRKIGSASSSATAVSLRYLNEYRVEVNDRYYVDTTYTFDGRLPVFFGVIQQALTERKLKPVAEGDEVASTTNRKYEISYQGYDLSQLGPSYSSYPNARYCGLAYNVVGGKKVFNFPYSFLTCSTNAMVNANPGPDATMDYIPNVAL